MPRHTETLVRLARERGLPLDLFRESPEALLRSAHVHENGQRMEEPYAGPADLPRAFERLASTWERLERRRTAVAALLGPDAGPVLPAWCYDVHPILRIAFEGLDVEPDHALHDRPEKMTNGWRTDMTEIAHLYSHGPVKTRLRILGMDVWPDSFLMGRDATELLILKRTDDGANTVVQLQTQIQVPDTILSGCGGRDLGDVIAHPLWGHERPTGVTVTWAEEFPANGLNLYRFHLEEARVPFADAPKEISTKGWR